MENHVFSQDDFSNEHPQDRDSTLLASSLVPSTGELAIEAVDTLILPVAGEYAAPLPTPPALSTPPQRRGSGRLRALFIALLIVLLLLLLGSGGYILARPNLPASNATLSITPINQQFSKTYTVTATPDSTDATLNPIGVRRISYTTPAKTATVQATGTRHHDATYATGTLTLFVFSGMVPAGTYEVTSTSGVAVAFTLNSPPAFRTDTVVSARAVKAGSAGNIPANNFGIYQVSAGNDFSITQSSAFTGGSDGSNATVVAQADIDSATSQATNQLQSGLADDQAQLRSKLETGEQLLGRDEAIACQPSLKANQQANDEASQVTVTGTMTCSGLAYNSDQLQTYATNHLTANTAAQVSSGYALIGQAQVKVSGQLDQGETVSCTLYVSGRFFYQFSPDVQAHLLSLIAGKTQSEAQKILLQQPGISSVSLTVSGGLGTAVPGDAKAIRVRITG